MKKTHLFLVAILLFGSLLRLWQLDKYPSGFNADEAAIGYNVFSLIETGRDEAGHKWPVNFQSFDDWKPGGYFYLTIPFVKTLGLNEWAVRLPSAMMGILAIYLVYLLGSEMFLSKKIGLTSAFLLSISPWHLHFSRGGWETNVATTLIILGVYLFIKGQKKPIFYTMSFLSFLASMYTYHSARMITPLLLMCLFLIYRKAVRLHFKTIILSAVIGLFFSIPLVTSLFSVAGISRFSGVGIFSDTGPIWRINELRGEHLPTEETMAVIFHNKIVAYSFKYMENYFSHFNGDFLFVNGDAIQRNRVPQMGLLYFFDLIFIPLGLYFLVKNISRNNLFILLWLIIAPIASSLTFQTPHALRAHNMVIPLVILSSFGFIGVLDWIKKRRIVVILLYCYVAILLPWSVVRYLHEYYVHYPQEYPSAWEYGFKDLVNYIKPIENNYEKIYVTDKYDQPYILFLFYLRYPPETFQKEDVLTPRDNFGFSTVKDFGKYHFDSIDWNNLKDKNNILVVGMSEEIPPSANIIKTINFPNQNPAFVIAKL